MTPTNDTHRPLFLAGLVVLAALAATTVAVGAVDAQETTTNATNGTAMGTTGMMTSSMGTTGMATTGTTAGGMASNASVTADPPGAGATSNHTVMMTLSSAPAGNLTGISVNYTAANASLFLTPEYIDTVNRSGESILGNVTNVQAIDGTVLNMTFDGNKSVTDGDTLTLVYQRVENPPEPGDYEVPVVVNTTNGSATLNATLTIKQASATRATTGATTGTTGMETSAMAGTTAGGETAGDTTAGGATTGGGAGSGETGGAGTSGNASGGASTSSNGPGFGVVVAVVGLALAAVSLARRDRN